MKYTVTTKTGKVFSVETDRTLDDAIGILARKGPNASNFEKDLISKRRVLSPKQSAWVHVLAEWTANPRKQKTCSDTFPRVLDMLTKAREAGKKFPKIKLDVDGKRVVLSLARNGKVNVTDGKPFFENQWYGAIQPDGIFRTARDAGSHILSTLRALEADPVAVATQHGVATGECCFCARELSTKESRSVGYGPICADRFGLPWGKVDPTLDKEGKKVFNI